MTYSILIVAQMATFILCNVVFVVWFHWAVVGVLAGQLVATGVLGVGGIAAVRPHLSWTMDARLAGRLLSFGLPFVPALLCLWAIDLSDRYLLSVFVKAEELGLYSLGYKVSQAMYFLVTAFTLGWGPLRFKILQDPAAKTIYTRVANLYVALAGLAWLVLALFAGDALRLVATPAFEGAERYVAPVGFGYFLYGLFVLTATGLGVAKRTASLPVIAALAAVVNIVANVALIPLCGPMAAAYSTVAAYALLAAGALLVSQRVYPIPYEYGRWGALVGGMLVLAAIGRALGPESWVASFSARLVCAAIGAGVVAASGVVLKSEWAAIRNAARGEQTENVRDQG